MHDDDTEPKILVLCFNKPLCQHLENEFSSFVNNSSLNKRVVQVMTYDKFVNAYLDSIVDCETDYQKEQVVLKSYKRIKEEGAPCTFKHIFVDEGQDFYGIKWPKILELFLVKDEDDDSLEPNYFWVMFDSNQFVQPSAVNINLHKKYLRNATRLTKVVRNTGHIFNASKAHYDSLLCEQIELGHHVIGLEVRWDDSLVFETKQTEGPQLVARHIHDLFSKGVKPNDICVLTTNSSAGENLSVNLLDIGIPCQNAENQYLSGEQDSSERIFVESIRRFKGLESKVVILYDPTSTKTRGQLKALLYSGITRCFCFLIILSTKRDCDLIRSGNLIGSPSRKRGAAEGASEVTKIKKPLF